MRFIRNQSFHNLMHGMGKKKKCITALFPIADEMFPKIIVLGLDLPLEIIYVQLVVRLLAGLDGLHRATRS